MICIELKGEGLGCSMLLTPPPPTFHVERCGENNWRVAIEIKSVRERQHCCDEGQISPCRVPQERIGVFRGYPLT